MKNKIGWCSMTWNPVWGCKNKCEYCYARGIAKRFYKIIAEKEHRYTHKYRINSHIEWKVLENRLNNFKPTFLESQFEKKFPKSPQRIFIGSMSEIYYWKEKWMGMVNEKINQHPQHTFMFLTKHPEVYAKYLWTKNCWFGVTMTENKRIEKAFCIPTRKGIKFLSIEPVLEKIDIEYIDEYKPNWVIIGAETGNRKGKVIPKKEWIESIVNYCKEASIPVYLKDSLKNIYPVEIKEFFRR